MTWKTKMTWTLKLGLLAVALLVAVNEQAQAALTFDFSFTNAFGNVPGTVTGRILGLNDDSTGPASQVIIDSLPAIFVPSLGTPPLDTSAGLWGPPLQNSFTVAAGDLSSATYQSIYSPNLAQFQILSGDGILFTQEGSVILEGPITFTLESSSVPEPGSITVWFAMTFLAAGWFHVVRRRRRASDSSPVG